MKNKQLKSLSAKVITMLTVAVFMAGMFASTAWAKQMATYKYRGPGDTVHTIEIDLSWQNSFVGAGRGMNYRYCDFEFISLDGVPWQDTAYANQVKEGIYCELGWDGYLRNNPDLLEIVFDKRFNGLGHKVCKLYNEGKSVSEIKQILLGNEESPDQNAQDTAKDDPVAEEPPVPTATEDEDGIVVLRLGQPGYAVAQQGSWEQRNLDVAPVNSNGRTLIPLRGIMEEFGASVEWVPESKQIIVSMDDVGVLLTVGSIEAMVNGNPASLDAPAKIVNGHTLIPLRFVSEQLGMNVVWNGATQSITIKKAS